MNVLHSTVVVFVVLVLLQGSVRADEQVVEGGAKCPNITAFRSPSVLEGFKPALLDGFWYEQAFIDIAQIGAACQTLNSTLDAATGEVQYHTVALQYECRQCNEVWQLRTIC